MTPFAINAGKLSTISTYFLPIFIFCFAFLSGCQGSHVTEEPKGDSGKTRFPLNENSIKILNEDLQTFNSEIETNPGSSSAYIGRALIHLQETSTYEDAIRDSETALSINPDLAEPYIIRAAALVDIGHSGLYSVPGASGNTMSDLWLLSTRKRHEKAITDIGKFLEIEPGRSDAYFIRAHAFMDLHLSNESIKDFDKVLQHEPSLYLRIMALVHRSQAHRQLGNVQLAVQDATTAMELLPDLEETYENIPKLINWHGDDFGPNKIKATAYVNRGLAYDVDGSDQLAIRDYSSAIEYDHTYIEAYINRATTYTSIGLYEEALSDAEEAIGSHRFTVNGSNTGLAEAYNTRAMANFGLGNIERGVSDVSQAITIDGNFARAYSNRSYMYTSVKELDLTITDASKAIELDPDLASAYANRAEAHLRSNNLSKAVEDSTSALSRDSSLVGARVSRAISYLGMEEYTAAFEDANIVLTQIADYPEALFVRGASHLWITGGEKGHEDLRKVVELSNSKSLVEAAGSMLSFYDK